MMDAALDGRAGGRTDGLTVDGQAGVREDGPTGRDNISFSSKDDQLQKG